MTSSLASLQQLLQHHSITQYGIIPFSAVSDHLIPCRAKSRIPQNAKSVIVMLFPYYIAPFRERNISLYAVVPDYHTIVLEILTQIKEEFAAAFPQNAAVFVDSSPIPEVEAAAKAGLGVIGQNGLLLNPIYGSYCFIGTVVTDLELDGAEQEIKRCISCGKCKEACPGQVISGGKIDYSRCLSALTQKKKAFTESEQIAIAQSGMVWGCDRCQEVCPYNQNPKQTEIQAFLQGAVPVIDENNVESLFADRAFAWRGEAVIRRNLKLVKEKVCRL